uniref:CNH domain-containing protein n=1 Tax=Rhabditophanes sp. KR3021 TaxID=114890 RepID=A0AC35TPK6_9BILA
MAYVPTSTDNIFENLHKQLRDERRNLEECSLLLDNTLTSAKDEIEKAVKIEKDSCAKKMAELETKLKNEMEHKLYLAEQRHRLEIDQLKKEHNNELISLFKGVHIVLDDDTINKHETKEETIGREESGLYDNVIVSPQNMADLEREIFEDGVEKRNGWVNVGDLQNILHFKIIRYERIKFLIIGLEDSIELHAWTLRPYNRFMAFKSFGELGHQPLIVDLTIEESARLKILYGSNAGFHSIDLDSTKISDIYIPPTNGRHQVVPHCIVILPNSNGMQLLLCYDNEGMYVNSFGKQTKNVILQWGETSSVAYISTGKIMGWGNKTIEIRSVDTGHLDGVFMHKRAQKLKFLCERNDKVFFPSAEGSGGSQIYFMTLNKVGLSNW